AARGGHRERRAGNTGLGELGLGALAEMAQQDHLVDRATHRLSPRRRRCRCLVPPDSMPRPSIHSTTGGGGGAASPVGLRRSSATAVATSAANTFAIFSSNPFISFLSALRP